MRTVETRDGEVRDVSPLLRGGVVGGWGVHAEPCCCVCTPEAPGKGLFLSVLNLFFLLQIIKESTTEHQDLP